MQINDVILDWFCLIRTKGIGPKTFWAMMRAYKTAAESLKHVEKPYPKIEAEKLLKRMNCEVILANDKLFPKSLRRFSTCPPLLFFKGDKEILSKRKVAIIGARNASINGRGIAKNLAENLSEYFAIVSGLAKGIDTSAHIGSLEGKKSAIAILPAGFDNIYPKENQRLFDEIAERGLALSEYPYGYFVDQGMFQARNRIISLIADGLIVIEAAYKSGTMATASMAVDFGCEVMVVPGSPTDPRNLGSNHLIKNGADLVQNHFDILDILGEDAVESSEQKELPLSSTTNQQPGNTGNDRDQRIDELLVLLSEAPTSLDELSVRLNIAVPELLCLVSELEISGKICRDANNEIVLSSNH